MRRIRNRVRCSERETENQSLISAMPSSISRRSNSGAWSHEELVLVVGAVPHHPLHAGPVVPGPVEQHDLAGRR